MRSPPRRPLERVVFTLALALAMFLLAVPFSTLAKLQRPAGHEGRVPVLSSTPPSPSPTSEFSTPAPSPTPSATPTPSSTPTQPSSYSQYFSLILGSGPPIVELLDTWTSDEDGFETQAFLPDDAMIFQAAGRNNRSSPVPIGIRMDLSGPCDAGQVFSGTLTLDTGDWQHSVPSTALDCTGVYTTSTRIAYQTITATLSTQHVVNLPSIVILSADQGFDRCLKPSLDQMQTWWDESPYSVFNLYIGGISFGCSSQPLDAVWVHRAARQGWTFILTWVGPQAPCSGFTHRMSWDANLAYWEGRIEAVGAGAAARDLGFFGDQVIYYDVEGYPDNGACRLAVRAFMRGWVDQLHEQGLSAGGYGAGCTSYISEWATNDPPPDYVWIAHWFRTRYDPDATVWNAPCVSNSLWADHQRIKQYTGGHIETWGGVPLNIDSNVLDGAITALQGDPQTQQEDKRSVSLKVFGAPLRDIGLLERSRGWALAGDKLLITSDGGDSWDDITPAGIRILGASMGASEQIWLVGWRDSEAGLEVARSQDGGRNWRSYPLPVSVNEMSHPVGGAYIDVPEEDTIWVALKLLSGNSFSIGRLFISQDGGESWEERRHPLGEAVQFLDKMHGWTAGGPAGDQLFRTKDGGMTWRSEKLDISTGHPFTVGLPVFSDRLVGWLPVALQASSGQRPAFFTTRDGGETWKFYDAQSPVLMGIPEELLNPESNLRPELWASRITKLPEGVVSVEFYDQQAAWAIVQRGACTGSKRGPVMGTPSAMEVPVCEQHWSLLATNDGGLSWREITP